MAITSPNSTNKLLWEEKKNALTAVRSNLTKLELTSNDVVLAIQNAVQENKNCKKGMLSGGFFKSRTENIFNDLLKAASEQQNLSNKIKLNNK